MDQLKTAMAFVVKHRFWFSMGLVAILAFCTYPTGARALMVKANQRKTALDGVYKDVDGYKSKVAPNTKWVEAADAKQKQVSDAVDVEWEKIYRQQEKLMTWPEQVAPIFGGRAFGAELTDNRSEHLIAYRFAFADQIDEIYYMLNPIMISDDGDKVYGIVDSSKAVIQSAIFDRNPNSIEAWLAQEELWIERAIIKAVAEANKGANSWKDAAVRRLVAIGIGNGGLDSKTASSNPTLVSGSPEAAAAPNPMSGFGQMGGSRRGFGAMTGKRGNQNIDPVRYLDKNERYRIVPVGVSMLVDQMKIPQVLAALANADFYFTIRQVSAGLPDGKVEEPRILREFGQVGESSARDNAVINTMQVDVWGVMRIYEMPPSMKEKREAEKKAKEEGASPGATPGQPAAPGGVTAQPGATPAPAAGATPATATPPMPAEGQPAAKAEAKPAEATKDGAAPAKPADAKAAETKPAETKPADAKAADSKDSAAPPKAAQAKAPEAKSAESKEAPKAEPKAEAKPAETKAESKAETKPAEKQ